MGNVNEDAFNDQQVDIIGLLLVRLRPTDSNSVKSIIFVRYTLE